MVYTHTELVNMTRFGKMTDVSIIEAKIAELERIEITVRYGFEYSSDDLKVVKNGIRNLKAKLKAIQHPKHANVEVLFNGNSVKHEEEKQQLILENSIEESRLKARISELESKCQTLEAKAENAVKVSEQSEKITRMWREKNDTICQLNADMVCFLMEKMINYNLSAEDKAMLIMLAKKYQEL